MNRATSNLGWTIVVIGLVSMTQVEAQKSKPLPPPNWPCVIVFGDAPDDKIRSDGEGPYVDGVDGVQCYVNRNGGGNDGNLFVNASRSSPRWFEFPDNVAVVAKPRVDYGYFENRQPGYFEITDIHDVEYVERARRIRVGVGGSTQFDAGEFWGDGLATDSLTSGTHSARVIATGPCTWDIAWQSAPGRVLALREGSARSRVRTGDFQLPLTATVTITGVKPGCPVP